MTLFREQLDEMSDESFQSLAGMLKKRMDPALIRFGAERIADFFAHVGSASKPVTDAGG